MFNFNSVKFKVSTALPRTHKSKRIMMTAISLAATILIVVSIFNVSHAEKSTVQVLRSTKVLTEGTQIVETDLKPVKVGEVGLPGNVIKEKDEVVGKYLKTNLYPSDNITPEKLTNKKPEAFDGLKEGQKLMSFTVPNLAGSVSGNIKPGDIIQVVYSQDITDVNGIKIDTAVLAPDTLKCLKVMDIKDDKGYVEDAQKQGGAKLVSSDSYIPSVITVIVDDQQAAELYKAELTKTAYAIFVERPKP